jgi:hypothetical protein
LAVLADSVLVVNHGVMRPGRTGYGSIDHTSFDVYVSRSRVLMDVPSPGAIVAYSRGSVFFAMRENGEWEVLEYAWRSTLPEN